jgi:hypothetical protein
LLLGLWYQPGGVEFEWNIEIDLRSDAYAASQASRFGLLEGLLDFAAGDNGLLGMTRSHCDQAKNEQSEFCFHSALSICCPE